MASRREEEKGFSLMEITIVVAIMMVTIAFAFPAVPNSLQHRVPALSPWRGAAFGLRPKLLAHRQSPHDPDGTVRGHPARAPTLALAGGRHHISLGATTLSTRSCDANCNATVDPGQKPLLSYFRPDVTSSIPARSVWRRRSQTDSADPCANLAGRRPFPAAPVGS